MVPMIGCCHRNNASKPMTKAGRVHQRLVFNKKLAMLKRDTQASP